MLTTIDETNKTLIGRKCSGRTESERVDQSSESLPVATSRRIGCFELEQCKEVISVLRRWNTAYERIMDE